MASSYSTPSESETKRLILVIDDDPNVHALLSMTFEGTEFELLSASDGQSGITEALNRAPDAILLDVRMPGVDGYEACCRLREFSSAPIIMLSGMRNDEEVVQGLNAGADDYVSKPFGPRELLARLRAQMRAHTRLGAPRRPQSFDGGALTLDLDAQVVRRNGFAVALSPTEFRILAYLAANAGRAVPLEELLAQVWGDVGQRIVPYVKVYVSRLRQRLGDLEHPPRIVQSVRNVGYRFAAQPDAERG